MFSLANDNISMISVWSRFRADIFSIMPICLSISAQLGCKIKLVPFWFHLNAIPNFVIDNNLSCTSVFQDTTNNHTSSHIVVFRNFPKPDFIDPVDKS